MQVMKTAEQKRVIWAWLQGVFYTVSGIWPLVDIDSFQFVTGPKVDLWLVRTVGLLLAVVGLALLRAARRRHVSADLIFVAAGQALALAVIDVVYVTAGRISPIYLLDALAELVLVVGWILLGRGTSEERPVQESH
jgi:energy-converting hydrogenase Eha subunit E